MKTIDRVLREWQSKKRRMGCWSASHWFVKRRPDFHIVTLPRYTKQGDYFAHLVCTNGKIIIDISPYADKPREDKP